ncbi:MAG: AI-2E family transporter [Gemmatimonadales bacterium]
MSTGIIPAMGADPRPGNPGLRVNPVAVLATLAALYTLYFARSFLLPVTFAILLNFLLSPAVRWLARLKIPAPVSAALVVLALVAGVGFAAYELAGPVRTWAEQAPRSIATTRRELGKLLRPFERVSRTAREVETAAAGAGGGPPAQEVVVRGPSLMTRAIGSTQRVVAGLIEVVILLYFLLAAGDLFLRKLIKVLPHLTDKLKAIRIARQTEASISTYLLTSALINLIEGAVVAGAMSLVGMPNPLLWGALVFLLEFIPYLGAFAAVVVLFVAALDTYQSLGRALLPPAVFLVINTLQVNLLYPALQARRLALNPVALLIGLAFWFWIWGVPGAFIAVPILATLKICADHIESLAPLGEFLSAKEETPLP